MHAVILDILFFCVEVAGFQCHHLNDAKSFVVGELDRGVMPKTVSSLAQSPDLGTLNRIGNRFKTCALLCTRQY